MFNSRVGKTLLALLVVTSFIAAIHSQRVGGLGEERVSDNEVEQVINKARKMIDQNYPRTIKSIEPISYKVQTVAGKNYFIKAIIHEADGDDVLVHLRIYKSFRGTVELSSNKTDVKCQDPIEYFE